MLTIKNLTIGDITPGMLLDFHHSKLIRKKFQKVARPAHETYEWEVVETNDLAKWSREKRTWIPEYLQEQVSRGGSAVGTYDQGRLVGFGCVDGYLYGETAKYANLTMLFVDDEYQRRGIGKAMFRELCKCAVRIGAEKLFISAVPSVETVAFYFSMGCLDAKEVIPDYVDTERDRYLEYRL